MMMLLCKNRNLVLLWIFISIVNLLVESASVAGVAKAGGCVREILPPREFKVEKFSGTWYEVARIYASPHSKNLTSAVVNFQMKNQGEMKITFGGAVDGKCINPVIVVADVSNQNKAQLIVHGPQPMELTILDTDYTSYALVYGCSSEVGLSGKCTAHDEQVNILSRTSNMDPAARTWYNEIIETKLCMDVNRLVDVQHDNVCEPHPLYQKQIEPVKYPFLYWYYLKQIEKEMFNDLKSSGSKFNMELDETVTEKIESKNITKGDEGFGSFYFRTEEVERNAMNQNQHDELENGSGSIEGKNKDTNEEDIEDGNDYLDEEDEDFDEDLDEDLDEDDEHLDEIGEECDENDEECDEIYEHEGENQEKETENNESNNNDNQHQEDGKKESQDYSQMINEPYEEDLMMTEIQETAEENNKIIMPRPQHELINSLYSYNKNMKDANMEVSEEIPNQIQQEEQHLYNNIPSYVMMRNKTPTEDEPEDTVNLADNSIGDEVSAGRHINNSESGEEFNPQNQDNMETKKEDDENINFVDLKSQENFDAAKFVGVWYHIYILKWSLRKYNSQVNSIQLLSDGSLQAKSTHADNAECLPAVMTTYPQSKHDKDTWLFGTYGGVKVLYTDYQNAILYICNHVQRDNTCHKQDVEVEVITRISQHMVSSEVKGRLLQEVSRIGLSRDDFELMDNRAVDECKLEVTGSRSCSVDSYVAQEKLDIIEFSGVWYEVARTRYSPHDIWNSGIAYFNISSENLIRFLYTGTSSKQCQGPFEGHLISAGDKDDSGDFIMYVGNVETLGSPWNIHFSYKVLYTDYNVAITYSCLAQNEDGTCQENSQRMTILSRSRYIDDNTRALLKILILEKTCFKLTDLELTVLEKDCSTLLEHIDCSKQPVCMLECENGHVPEQYSCVCREQSGEEGEHFSGEDEEEEEEGSGASEGSGSVETLQDERKRISLLHALIQQGIHDNTRNLHSSLHEEVNTNGKDASHIDNAEFSGEDGITKRISEDLSYYTRDSNNINHNQVQTDSSGENPHREFVDGSGGSQEEMDVINLLVRKYGIGNMNIRDRHENNHDKNDIVVTEPYPNAVTGANEGEKGLMRTLYNWVNKYLKNYQNGHPKVL